MDDDLIETRYERLATGEILIDLTDPLGQLSVRLLVTLGGLRRNEQLGGRRITEREARAAMIAARIDVEETLRSAAVFRSSCWPST